MMDQNKKEKKKQFLYRINQEKIAQNIKKYSKEDRKNFYSQIEQINQTYPGGIEQYYNRAIKLLQDNKNDVNPYSNFSISVPKGEKIDYRDLQYMQSLERIGLEEIKQACFVLVAGGLGERLGYNGLKVSIPFELVTQQCFLQYYIKYILAYQKRGPPDLQIPLAIMTSDETHDKTVKLLEQNNYFGMVKNQVTLMKQWKVPTMSDSEGNFVLKKNKCELETKPHGHGDVHQLLHQTGLAEQWLKLNKQWIIIFQDSNPLIFRAYPSTLGVCKKKNLEMNFITVPRRPCEQTGAICKLVDTKTNQEFLQNIEYNIFEMLHHKVFGKKEQIDENGNSLFPGNTNSIILHLSEYCNVLQKTQGLIPEFVNIKFNSHDKLRIRFKKNVRLESMMQDYTKLLTSSERIGFTLYDRDFCFSALKNDLATARHNAKHGLALECAASCERDFYANNAELLRLCGAQIDQNNGSEEEIQSFCGIEVLFGPRIVLSPDFAVTLEEMKDKIQHGKLTVTAQSTVVLDGNFRLEGNNYVDGILKLNGNIATFRDIIIKDVRYHKFVNTYQSEGVVAGQDSQSSQQGKSSEPEYLKIRGYTIREGRTLQALGRCKVKGHERHSLVVFCLQKDCKEKRIACPKCICELHGNHAKKCLFLRDILKASDSNIETSIYGWSNQLLYQKMLDLSKQLEEDCNPDRFPISQMNIINQCNMSMASLQEIDSPRIQQHFSQQQVESRPTMEEELDESEERITENIEFQRMQMKESFKESQKFITQVMSQLQQKFNQVYNLQEVFKSLRMYIKKQINQQEFNDKIKNFIKDENRLQAYKEMDQLFKKKQKFCPEVNRTYFKESSKCLIQQIELNYQVLTIGNWYFIAPKFGIYNNNLKILEPGKSFQFNNLDQQQYVYGSQPMSGRKEYSWIIEFDGFQQTSYQSVHVGVLNDSKKEEMNSVFQAGQSSYIDLVNASQSQYMQIQTGKKSLSEIIKKKSIKNEPIKIHFKLNFIDKSFKIYDSTEEGYHEYSLTRVQAATRSNPYNYQYHQQFFQSSTKLRPFIISYSASCKITLVDY